MTPPLGEELGPVPGEQGQAPGGGSNPEPEPGTEPVVHALHLNGPEYGVGDYTAATGPFHQHNLGAVDRDYHYDRPESLTRLASDGWRLVKLPIRWERIQDEISGPLRSAEVELVRTFLDHTQAAGLKVILDVHNYGLYYQDLDGQGVARNIGDPQLPISAFADLWTRLSEEFGNHPAVHAYAIMAEPQSMLGLTGETWREASQAAVSAIRATGDTTEIHVAGWGWSSTADWPWYNGETPWIVDPADNIRYEGHHYWDSDRGGAYVESYADSLAAAESQVQDVGDHPTALHKRVFDELKTFTDWLERNHVRGIIGEAGWATDPEWQVLGKDYLARCTALGIPVIGWFAGEWAGSDADMRLYEEGHPIGAARPQVAVWKQFL